MQLTNINGALSQINKSLTECNAVAVCSAHPAGRQRWILSEKPQNSPQVAFCDADLWL